VIVPSGIRSRAGVVAITMASAPQCVPDVHRPRPEVPPARSRRLDLGDDPTLLRDAIERLGGRLETTRDLLDRMADGLTAAAPGTDVVPGTSSAVPAGPNPARPAGPADRRPDVPSALAGAVRPRPDAG